MSGWWLPTDLRDARLSNVDAEADDEAKVLTDFTRWSTPRMATARTIAAATPTEARRLEAAHLDAYRAEALERHLLVFCGAVKAFNAARRGMRRRGRKAWWLRRKARLSLALGRPETLELERVVELPSYERGVGTSRRG